MENANQYLPLILSIFPVILLIWLMVKKNSVPSYIALPGVAFFIYLLQLFYFKNDFMTLNANAAAGVVATLTPITVIFGAIFFNRMMEATGCITVIRQWLGNINQNPVAQLMIIGWAFAFMIEGASGFGTPAAIAAPILVGLGFKPMQVAVFTLVMNSVPVSFGAVGTPTWFGFGQLKDSNLLSDADILQIGKETGLMHFVAAFIVPVIALRFITGWAEIRKNIGFIYLSILACTIPYLLLAQVNYEFPSLVGGGIGLLLSVFLANHGIGLEKIKQDVAYSKLETATVLKALMPLGMLMLILIVTRIHELGIKALLNDVTPLFTLHLGVCDFEVSRALIISFKNIFGQGVNESYKTLYVPAFIPFVITVWLSLIIFRTSFRDSFKVYYTTLEQTIKPLLALFGALVMMKFMMIGGETSMVKIIGNSFATMTGANWAYFASYLGAIGAFFSGSNTVSNLTFGSIQYSIADKVGLSTNSTLALQSVGGAMGNMVCINNIIAVCSVLNVQNQEGAIIKKTAIPMFIYGVIAAIVAALFLL
ncbi:MAG: L-lactate permease [Cardiobacteriaceae bacterium]|nr:L-lactate permease [Cardiobacteriaceae bacterium]